MRVEEDVFFRAISDFMLPYSEGRFSRLGIDIPKRHALLLKLLLKPLHLRNVTIGNRAVSRRKKKDYRLRARNS